MYNKIKLKYDTQNANKYLIHVQRKCINFFIRGFQLIALMLQTPKAKYIRLHIVAGMV